MAKKTVKGKARKGSVAKALVQAVKAVATPPKKTVKGKKFVYFFGAGKADGDRTMKDTLGGKGSGLAEMTNAGLPVPPGFTISTDVCNIYYAEKGKVPAEIDREIDANLAKLEKATGKTLGDVGNPLLVSVRSGAKFSMPGMMDTILNLGLNDATVEGLKAKTGNGRFAYDSYRRFMQMFGNVVMSIPKEKFEHEFEAVKHERGAKSDTELDESGLQEVVTRYKALVKRETGKPFPQDGLTQLRGVARCGVQVVDESARQGIPAYLRDSRPHRHGRQRPGDGVRQHRRTLSHGRRLHTESRHGHP